MNDPALDADELTVMPFKVAETHDPIAYFVVGEDEPETAVKVAGVLRVVNEGKGAARLYIDDVMFGYATADGFDVHTGSRRHGGNTPAVTLTIIARRVEVVDDIKPPPPAPLLLLDVPTSTT